MATAVKDVREIGRMPAYVDDNPLLEEVLTKARKNFDYTAHDLSERGPLGKALKELDIQPLDKLAVRAYKKSKERDYKTGAIAARGLATLLVPLAVGTILAMIEVQKFHISAESFIFFATIIATVVTVIISMSVFGAMVENDQITKTHHVWSWEDYDLRNSPTYAHYPRFIPAYVLNLANQICEKVPRAQFGVEELTHKVEKMANPVPDPFLWVKLDGELYYIEAWDERDFRDNRR